MTEIFGCLVFLWAFAMLIGVVMVEYRLSKMQRMMERQEKRDNQLTAAYLADRGSK